MTTLLGIHRLRRNVGRPNTWFIRGLASLRHDLGSGQWRVQVNRVYASECSPTPETAARYLGPNGAM